MWTKRALNVLLPALRGLWTQVPVPLHNVMELVQGITLTMEGRRMQWTLLIGNLPTPKELVQEAQELSI